jgi:hypothetical protein
MRMEGYPDFSMSAAFFKWWGLDLETGELKVQLRSGELITKQLEPDGRLTSDYISKSIFDWDNGLIGLVTKRNHVVFFEPYQPLGENPKAGRPVVYLDQNHWNTIAQVMANPALVRTQSEVEPARHLIRLAQDGGIILPISSGHLRETTPLTGNRRYQQGVAMSNFSAGWQLRHPSRVWRDEHARMLAAELNLPVPQSALAPVFTLEPHALLDDGVEACELDPDELDLFVLIVSSPMVILEVLLNPTIEAILNPSAWVSRNQLITDHLARSQLSAARKRATALSYIWGDNAQPVDEALRLLGADPKLRESFDLAQQMALLRSQPFTSLFTDLFVQRHISSSTVWKENDLIDLMFLCCATGYADFVAAEKHTGTQLIQAQRARQGSTTVHLNLESLVSALLASGVESWAEKQTR